MKLVFLVGSGAVGKMTVGQELSKITELKLFHNHMIIEPVLEIFDRFDTTVIKRLRDVIFEEFSRSNRYGMIFTLLWAFDMKEDWDYVEHVCEIFRRVNADIYFVELVASQEVRLERNKTENRLAHKASKRNVEFSSKRIINEDETYRTESYDGEIPYENYIKIDNTNLSPEDVARKIKERFDLE